jgi:hypothetical protein
MTNHPNRSARDLRNSALCHTPSAKRAKKRGYDVHHDILGWYVVAPGEEESADGYSLGFDGREHFDRCHEAWRAADERKGEVCRPFRAA